MTIHRSYAYGYLCMAEDIRCIVWPAVSTYYSHHECMKFMHYIANVGFNVVF